MDVRGTAFLARKLMLLDEIGEERFDVLLQEVARVEPVFAEPIHATTLIPMRSFAVFNEALVQTLYSGDTSSYLRFGESSAEYGLLLGPYKRIRETNSVAVFVECARIVYQGYYTEGRAEGSLAGNVAEVKLHGIQPEDRYLYLEYAIAGYVRRGIELVSLHSASMERLRGFSCGDEEVHYRYFIEDGPAPAPFGGRMGRHSPSSVPPSGAGAGPPNVEPARASR